MKCEEFYFQSPQIMQGAQPQLYPFQNPSQMRNCFAQSTACLREGLRPGWNCNEAWPNVLGPDTGQRQRVDYQDAKGGWHHTTCGPQLPPHLQNLGIRYPRQLDELAEGRQFTPLSQYAALQAPLSPRSLNRPLLPRPVSPRLGDAHWRNPVQQPIYPQYYVHGAASPRSRQIDYASVPLH